MTTVPLKAIASLGFVVTELLGAGIGSPSQSVYFRRVDEPEAVRLGEGTAIELSPDGKWVLSFLNHSLILLPIGPGQSKKIKCR